MFKGIVWKAVSMSTTKFNDMPMRDSLVRDFVFQKIGSSGFAAPKGRSV